ncbi:MAG: GYF domain-containing protein [Verrucomicrobiota bacterium]
MKIFVITQRNGERIGPFDPLAIYERLDQGDIAPDDLAWVIPMRDWQPLYAILPEEEYRHFVPGGPPRAPGLLLPSMRSTRPVGVWTFSAGPTNPPEAKAAPPPVTPVKMKPQRSGTRLKPRPPSSGQSSPQEPPASPEVELSKPTDPPAPAPVEPKKWGLHRPAAHIKVRPISSKLPAPPPSASSEKKLAQIPAPPEAKAAAVPVEPINEKPPRFPQTKLRLHSSDKPVLPEPPLFPEVEPSKLSRWRTLILIITVATVLAVLLGAAFYRQRQKSPLLKETERASNLAAHREPPADQPSAADIKQRDKATAELDERIQKLPAKASSASSRFYSDLHVSIAKGTSPAVPWKATMRGTEHIVDPTSLGPLSRTDFTLLLDYQQGEWIFKRYEAALANLKGSAPTTISADNPNATPPAIVNELGLKLR